MTFLTLTGIFLFVAAVGCCAAVWIVLNHAPGTDQRD
jgi:hypothetical protein